MPTATAQADLDAIIKRVADLVIAKISASTPATPYEPWKSTRDAAAYTGYSPVYLENLRHRGGGPKYYKPTENVIRYKTSDLDDWIMRDGKQRSTADTPPTNRGRKRKVAA